MDSSAEYLTKRLFIEKEIITYRHLSRALSLHVNVAKKELDFFYASSKAKGETVHATYLLTGDAPATKARGTFLDDDDSEAEENDIEMIPTFKILLVGEDELEAAKARFTRLSSIHVYSLSPSPIRDAALLTTSVDYVRSQDVNKGKEFQQMVGIVVGEDVKVRSPAFKHGSTSGASSSKAKRPFQDKKATEGPSGFDAESKGTEKEKKQGTLDWGNAKLKTEKRKEQSSVKESTKPAKKPTKAEAKEMEESDDEKSRRKQEKETPKAHDPKGKGSSAKEPRARPDKDIDSNKAVKLESEESEDDIRKDVVHETIKKGKKRPSAVLDLSEDGEDEADNKPSPKTRRKTSDSRRGSKLASTSEKNIKIHRGALISDEDEVPDTNPKISKQKGKGKAKASSDHDDEASMRSIRAIMDLDDSHFINHNNSTTEPQPQEDDAEMASGSESIPAPKRKRKPKKVVPVGKNGLPKKRVVKTKKSKDARGYMITQDYSSYESVSETEQDAAASGLDKTTAKRGKKATNGPETENASSLEKPTKPRPKPRLGTNSTADGDSSSIEKSDAKRPSAAEAKTTSRKTSSDHKSTKAHTGKSPSGKKNNLMSYFAKK